MRYPAGCLSLPRAANKSVALNSWWGAAGLFAQAFRFHTDGLIEKVNLLGKMEPGHALPSLICRRERYRSLSHRRLQATLAGDIGTMIRHREGCKELATRKTTGENA
ncbi:hypothetical protein ACVWY5_006790 [Bradyrhizobium sp. USDA 3256]